MLPKVNRLKEDRRFKYILQKGSKIRTPYFIICYNRTGEPVPPKIGIIASKKVGKAVQRNRAKRIVSEAFRSIIKDIPEGTETVIICLKGIEEQNSKNLAQIVSNIRFL